MQTRLSSPRSSSASLPCLPSLFLCLSLLLLCSSSFLPLVASQSTPSYIALTNDQPLLLSVLVNGTAYFTFTSPAVSHPQTALFALDALTGFPSLYVSFTASPIPSPTSFAYASSSATGGVVSIATQPPWTAYIAVVASPYSSTNFTLTATVYDPSVKQTDTIVLTDAQPQASALAAGEYRYYVYTLSTPNTAGSLTIADTETLGSTVIVVNGPGMTALPTLSSCQYSTLTSALHVVYLLNATAGVYRIGVWSNVTSIFSLIAVSSTSVQPMQLGVVYPGVVQSFRYRYYSVYLDPQLLPTSGYLAITLTSLSGDGDLYCSNTTATPDQIDSRWRSIAITPVDEVFIASSTLWPGVIYCGVQGYDSMPDYTLSSSFGTYTALSASTPTEGLTVAAGQSLYSYTFEGNSSQTGAFVTVSAVSSYGATQLRMAYYGQTPSGQIYEWVTSVPLAVHHVQIATADICGGRTFAHAIPGSSPLLCQLNILVTTTQATSYRISIGSAQSVVPLIAGQQVEGAASASQSASFSFVVPDNLSNLTLLVAVTSDASDVVMTVATGARGDTLGRVLWTVSQQPGQSVLAFQLDWNNPLLPAPYVIAGVYVVSLSTQQNATFAVSYTLTNRTGNGGTITPLMDGMPQAAVVQAGQYAFFYLGSLPTAGWPYSVTFAIEWQSGSGIMAVVTGDGTQPAPLAGAAQLISSSSNPVLTVTNGTRYSCSPMSLLPSGQACGYAVSVFVNPLTQGPAQFTLTATTGGWVRTLTANVRSGAGQLAAGGIDAWQQTQITANGRSATLIVAFTVTSGTVTVYASNTTASPNASQAQWRLQGVQSVDSLLVPLDPSVWDGTVFFTVLCSGGSGCGYEVQTVVYLPDSTRLITLRQTPPVLAIIPGGISYLAINLLSLSSLAWLSVEVLATIGSPALYASCGSDSSGRPSEAQHTWTAEGPGPIALELTDLALSPSCQYLVMGIRATGSQVTLGSLVVLVAGLQQDITAVWYTVGLLSPAYPASYFVYTLNPNMVDAVAFTLTTTPASCLASTQLYVSADPSVMYPSAAAYTFKGGLVTFGDGQQSLSVLLHNTSVPAGSYRAGPYYLAVVSTSATATCQFALQNSGRGNQVLQEGVELWDYISNSSPAFYSFPLQASTAATLAVSVTSGSGLTQLYVGVDSRPVPGDPSTYVLVKSNPVTTQTGPVPIYLPPSACAQRSVCTVFITAIGRSDYSFLYITPTTNAGNIRLTDSQPFMALNSSHRYTHYQFSLPSTPQTVSVSVQSATPAQVVCSYQFVQPDGSSYDWMSQLQGSSNATALTFPWSAALQVNPSTTLSAAPTTCYCSVLPSNAASPYTIAFTATPSAPSSTSSSSGLSKGALAAAIVVPVVCAAVLAAVLWWLWSSGGCSRLASGLKQKGGDDGRMWSQQEESGGEAGGVAMTDLHKQRWDSSA